MSCKHEQSLIWRWWWSRRVECTCCGDLFQLNFKWGLSWWVASVVAPSVDSTSNWHSQNMCQNLVFQEFSWGTATSCNKADISICFQSTASVSVNPQTTGSCLMCSWNKSATVINRKVYISLLLGDSVRPRTFRKFLVRLRVRWLIDSNFQVALRKLQGNACHQQQPLRSVQYVPHIRALAQLHPWRECTDSVLQQRRDRMANVSQSRPHTWDHMSTLLPITE